MTPQDPNQMQAPGQAPAAPAQQAPAGPQGEAGDMEKFSQATKLASNIIYDEGVFKELAERAKSGSVLDALTTTVVMVISQVEQSIGELSLEHLFALGMMLVVDVADALTQGGIEVGQEEINRALSDAITMFLQQNHGRFSKEELEAAVAQLQQTQANAGAMEQQLQGAGQGQPAAPAGPGPQDPGQRGLLSGGAL